MADGESVILFPCVIPTTWSDVSEGMSAGGATKRVALFFSTASFRCFDTISSSSVDVDVAVGVEGIDCTVVADICTSQSTDTVTATVATV